MHDFLFNLCNTFPTPVSSLVALIMLPETRRGITCVINKLNNNSPVTLDIRRGPQLALLPLSVSSLFRIFDLFDEISLVILNLARGSNSGQPDWP
jgi:hypothetical protein